VAIDGRELLGQPTGVGRFLAGILAGWETLDAAAAHEFVLCTPGPIAQRIGSRVSTLVRHGGSGTAWEQLTLPRLVREMDADVLFAPAYTGPIRCPAPMVVAIYDVSFAAHPEWFGWRDGLRRRVLTHLAARHAARVVTTSAFSRSEITRLFGVDANRVEVIYPGAAPVTPVPHTENLVLFVGSLFTRRHLPALIDGFARLARERRDVRLEIVGDNRTTPRVDLERLAAASGAGERIALRAYLPEEALAALYGRARAFVFLSEYEGFGLTPLEALGAGVPIVVLDTAVAREVYGDAALYVPRPDPALVAAAIERVLFDAAERTRILEAARRLLPRYSWRACAERVLTVLTECART